MKNDLWQDDFRINNSLEISDKYDREFINLIVEIENQYHKLSKQDKLKVESWVKRLCYPTHSNEFKKNRNLHVILLLDCIINDKLISPYDKFAKVSDSLPVVDKIIIKSTISQKLKNMTVLQTDRNYYNYTNFYFSKYINPGLDLKNKKKEFNNCLFSLNEKGSKNKKTKNKVNIPSKLSKSEYSIDFDFHEKNIVKMKRFLNNLKEDLNKKEILIIRQNQNKQDLEKRILNLENAIQNFLIDKKVVKENLKLYEMLLLNNKYY